MRDLASKGWQHIGSSPGTVDDHYRGGHGRQQYLGSSSTHLYHESSMSVDKSRSNRYRGNKQNKNIQLNVKTFGKRFFKIQFLFFKKKSVKNHIAVYTSMSLYIRSNRVALR